MSAPERLLTISQVCDRVPYSRVHIYRLIKRGQFPDRVRVGPNRVGWREAAVQEWIRSKVTASTDLPQSPP
jgi:prophage regulatory protein